MTIPVDPLAPPGPTARTLRLRIRPQMLPGMALLAILFVGLMSSLYALAFKRAELPAEDVSWSGLASGDTTVALANFLQKENPLADALVTTDRVAAYLTTGDLGSRVRRGCGDWLFLIDELALHPDRAANFARHVAIVKQVAGFLKGRNIALLVVPIPDKSRVEAAQLCGVDRSAALGSRFADFATTLRGGGLNVVDLLQPMASLDGERYYRTDTHWNERGARLAADTIAGVLRQDRLAPDQKAEFRVSVEHSHERIGDLIRLAGLDRVPYPLRPRGDAEAPTMVEQSAAATVGILDETPPPQLAVIGTSFSRRANFVPFLSLALGAPVDNKALDGGGVTSAAIAYFALAEFAKTSPRAIVWEIPERMIEEPVPDSDARWVETLGDRRPDR
jgi:alginate O-acetyltransferase complex protein AlgJ